MNKQKCLQKHRNFRKKQIKYRIKNYNLWNKRWLDSLNSILETVEDRVGKLFDKSSESIQFEENAFEEGTEPPWLAGQYQEV